MIPDPTPPLLVAAGYAELVRRAGVALDAEIVALERQGARVRHARRRLMLLCDRAEAATLEAARAVQREDEVLAALETSSRT